ncbi:MAG: hypothetical protein ABH873_02510 [Candidatus Firestonebacteria bacterium]
MKKMLKLGMFLLMFSGYIHPIDIEVLPHKVSLGDVFVVRVFEKDKINLTIGKSTFPTFISNDRKFRQVILGVPSWWKAGRYPVFINGEEANISLEIIRKEFPTQEIKIAPEKVIENEETKKQREIIFKKILTKTEEKIWKGKFIIPVEGRITTDFGMKRKVNNETRGYHKGIDISANTGTIIKASNEGVVKKGQTMAKVGATGLATGAHLHWGMYIFGVDVNPLNFINNLYD